MKNEIEKMQMDDMHKTIVLQIGEIGQLKETIRKRNLLIKQLRKDVKYWCDNANELLVINTKLEYDVNFERQEHLEHHKED